MADLLSHHLTYGYPPEDLKQMLLTALCDTQAFDPYIVHQVLTVPTPDVITPDPDLQKSLDGAKRTLRIWQSLSDEEWARDYAQNKPTLERMPEVWDSLVDVVGIKRGERSLKIDQLKDELLGWNPSRRDFWQAEYEFLDDLRFFVLGVLEQAARSSRPKRYQIAASVEEYRQQKIREAEKAVRDYDIAVKKAQLKAEEATAMLHTLLESLSATQTEESVVESESSPTS